MPTICISIKNCFLLLLYELPIWCSSEPWCSHEVSNRFCWQIKTSAIELLVLSTFIPSKEVKPREQNTIIISFKLFSSSNMHPTDLKIVTLNVCRFFRPYICPGNRISSFLCFSVARISVATCIMALADWDWSHHQGGIKTIFLSKSEVMFSRPWQSQGLLYNHLRD